MQFLNMQNSYGMQEMPVYQLTTMPVTDETSMAHQRINPQNFLPVAEDKQKQQRSDLAQQERVREARRIADERRKAIKSIQSYFCEKKRPSALASNLIGMPTWIIIPIYVYTGTSQMKTKQSFSDSL